MYKFLYNVTWTLFLWQTCMRDMGIPEDDINGKFSIFLKLWHSHQQCNLRKGNRMSINQTALSHLPGHNEYLLNVHMLVILTWREPCTKPLGCSWICFLSYICTSLLLFLHLSLLPFLYFLIPLSPALSPLLTCLLSPSISHLLADTGL